MSSSKAVVLNWGDFAPHHPLQAPGWGEHFALSGDIFVCHNWVGGVPGIERPEKLLSVLEGTGQPPTTKNYPLQSVTSVEAKKLL